MCGLDGKTDKHQTKMTWDEFTKWQRWDEFPELEDNPPMTVDIAFEYNGSCFYIDMISGEYVLQTESWDVIASDANFLKLLTAPLEIFGGSSLQELIQTFDFEA